MIEKTTNDIIGKRACFMTYAGDEVLRGDDMGCQPGWLTLGASGVIVGLYGHEGIGTYGSSEQEKEDDRWICLSINGVGYTFWKEELTLVD